MTPSYPVDLLAAAISRQEGFFAAGSTIPKTRNNPGDLDYAGQIGAARPPLGSADLDIAMFATLPTGVSALYRQLWLQIAQGQTVRQIVEQWAPAAGGNNSVAYLANVLEWTGLPPNVPVLQLLPPLVPLNGSST